MRLVMPMGGTPRHVEFRIDASFCERLRQLRTLVPLATGLNRQRDLVIDKVRARLPNSVWRRADTPIGVTGACLVVSSEGVFHCGAKEVEGGYKLLGCTFPISRLSELHAGRPVGETFFIQSGFFINDEPAESEAGRWAAKLHGIEGAVAVPEGASDFDSLLASGQRSDTLPQPLPRVA